MRGKFFQWLVTSFGEDADGPQRPPDPNNCNKTRPAIVTKAKCPGVGAEVQTEIKESNDICPPQPPPCCESAKRGEHAVKMIETMIGKNPFLKLFTMHSMPWQMCLLPPPPAVADCRSNRVPRSRRDFL